MGSMKSGGATIWDCEGAGLGSDPFLYWRSWERGDGLSIPQYVEEHSDRIRKKYLAFVYELGETLFSGKRVIDHLDAGDGFSYWWMSLISEKNPFKSSRLYGCIRLFALEEILIERQYKSITYVGGDQATKESIAKLCVNLNIDYIEVERPRVKKKYSLRSCFDALPSCIQGLVALCRHLLLRWCLRDLRRPKWFSGEDAIFLCSYFFNLDEAACESGDFQARQWGGLSDMLKKLNLKSNWIHHLVLNSGAPSREVGLKWMSLFNKHPSRLSKHAYLDTFLSKSVLKEAFRDWVNLTICSFKLRDINTAFRPKESAVDLWPLLKSDWKSSINGYVAVNNCLWKALFNTALKEMPHQRLGFYLWENQGWEMAMLHAWQRYGHGLIIGVPHATTVYWHLNNFDDIRTIKSGDILSKPSPNFLAINGPMAEHAFIAAGMPSEKLLKVEALRYQYLNKFPLESVGEKYTKFDSDSSSSERGNRLLILGDASFSQTIKMMNCIKRALLVKKINLQITLKPHPACKFEIKDYPDLSFNISKAPLESIINKFDIAFVGNTSSAALDALLSGLVVIVFLEDGDFNHSPLRGDDSVFFAASGLQFSSILNGENFGKSLHQKEDFFWLDGQMMGWRKILFNEDFSGKIST